MVMGKNLPLLPVMIFARYGNVKLVVQDVVVPQNLHVNLIVAQVEEEEIQYSKNFIFNNINFSYMNNDIFPYFVK